MIWYIRMDIGRVGLTDAQMAALTKSQKDRIKAEHRAHDTLEARFGCGWRALLVDNRRRIHCTVIDPHTLNYIADFPHRWLDPWRDGATWMAMRRVDWHRLATRMDRLRKLLDAAARKAANGRPTSKSNRAKRAKHDRAIKAAIAACRLRGNGKES